LKNKLIIKSGHLKNYIISFKKINKIKPTKDNIKCKLKTCLKNVKKIYILDLFSGTGSLCFELNSLNVKKIILIEIEKNTVNILNKNRKQIIKKHYFKVILDDAYTWLKKLNFLNLTIIFFDPPYKFKKYSDYMSLINNIKILQKFIIIILETDSNEKINFIPLNCFIFKKEKIGKTKIHLIKKI